MPLASRAAGLRLRPVPAPYSRRHDRGPEEQRRRPSVIALKPAAARTANATAISTWPAGGPTSMARPSVAGTTPATWRRPAERRRTSSTGTGEGVAEAGPIQATVERTSPLWGTCGGGPARSGAAG